MPYRGLGLGLCVLLSACGFEHGHLGGTSDSPDAAMPDAITSCTPNEKLCAGRKIEVCNPDGTGVDTSQTVVCPLSCVTESSGPACTQARNLPVDMQTACSKATGAALVLTAADGTNLAGELDADPPTENLVCWPGTNCAFQPIAPTGKQDQPGDRELLWYCLSELTMEMGTQLYLNDDSPYSPVFFVDGDVVIDGLIDNDGDYAGQAGAGAYRGGNVALGGTMGLGGCGGGNGATTGVGTSMVGGGGGGGGARSAGGAGGSGRDTATAAGGGAGAATCDPPMLLEPLVGGSGGGGGGNGACATPCAQAGGGGGGALQIVATGKIEIRTNGFIKSNGGGGGANATGSTNGGGGGGGAGGVILLEAPTVIIDGLLNVDGGYGGLSGAGNGGTPGTNTTAPTAGASYTTPPQGGAGGGGAVGRIRLESESTTACPPVTAAVDPCTSGALERVP
ncbi:MAG TPA: hypothetical protein VL326_14180 [Kofleriaceae bacterium]|jgi:hypothetical protein|nr:hypothetical protein [Kofleriaceae bacterium]